MKKLRLIQLFSGYGSQAMALKRAKIPYEDYKISEWDIYANRSYKAVHSIDETDYAKDYTKEELIKKLYQIQISTNGKKPLSLIHSSIALPIPPFKDPSSTVTIFLKS